MYGTMYYMYGIYIYAYMAPETTPIFYVFKYASPRQVVSG